MTIMLGQQVVPMAIAILSDNTRNKSEIKSLTNRVTSLTRAVDFWNHWMLWGLVAAAIAALWVVVATRLAIVRGKELAVAQQSLGTAKDAGLTLDLKEKDRQIAVAGASSAQALEQAKSAEAHLADANARASEANERAAASEVEALKLRQELLVQGPRENLLRGPNRALLVQVLKQFPGQRSDVRRSASIIEVNGAVVQSTPIGDDTIGLASALMAVMKDGGWDIPPTPLLENVVGSGIEVLIVGGASEQTIRASEALVQSLRALPLAVTGPFQVEEKRARRVGKDTTLPPFDKDTIVVEVLTHP